MKMVWMTGEFVPQINIQILYIYSQRGPAKNINFNLFFFILDRGSNILTLLTHGAMAILKQVFSSSNTFEILILQP